MNIENPMGVDSHWRHLEQPETKVIGECAGCQKDITADQDWYEVAQTTTSIGEQIIIHQNNECCSQYVAEMSFCRGPEE